MNTEQLLIALVIGAVAGWLAGLMMRKGLGLIANIIVGVVGGLIGGWLFKQFGITIGGKWVGPIATSTIGAVVLLFLIGLIRRK